MNERHIEYYVYSSDYAMTFMDSLTLVYGETRCAAFQNAMPRGRASERFLLDGSSVFDPVKSMLNGVTRSTRGYPQ